MGIKQTLDVLNAMQRDGVFDRFAIAGAVAAYNYIEPAVTEDLDIFVSFKGTSGSGLISLAPILDDLKKRGFTEFKKEGVLIAGWPVQFLPVADDLDAEALDKAETVDVKANGGSARVRVLRPEHLVAIAVRVGRAKDRVRILQFLQEKAVSLKPLKSVLARHKLMTAWRGFCQKAGTRDPFEAK